MSPRDFRPIDPQPTSVLGGLILLAIVLVGALIVQICRAMIAEDSRRWAVAWMKPGSADPGHQVKLHGDVVGEVVEVGAPERRLRVQVARAGESDLLDLTHLAVGDSASFFARPGDSTSVLVLHLPRWDHITLTLPHGVRTFEFQDSLGQWWITEAEETRPPPDSVLEPLHPCVRGGKSRCLREGDSLRVRDVDLTLRWRRMPQVSQIVMSLDETKIRRALTAGIAHIDTSASKDSTPQADSIRLTGVALRETGAFGIGRQGLKLVYPSVSPDLVERRPEYRFATRYGALVGVIVRPDPQVASELVTADDVDLEQVMAMADYLSDPTLRTVPPRTRWEDIIDDVGRSLASARTAVGKISAVTEEEGGQGAVGRLTLDRTAQRRLRETIDILPDLLAQLETLAGTIDTTVDSVGTGVRRLTTQVDTTLAALRPELVKALQAAQTLEDSLVTLTNELEATLKEIRKTAKPVGIALVVKLLTSTLVDLARLGGGGR